jgi:hypothetical protein
MTAPSTSPPRPVPASLAVFALGMVTACAPPAGALATRCEDHPLSTAPSFSCEVTSQRMDSPQAVYLDTQSSNAKTVVSLRLQVVKGRARVSLGADKAATWTLEAGVPLAVNADVVTTSTHRFPLWVEPIDSVVEGLSGTIDYKTP